MKDSIKTTATVDSRTARETACRRVLAAALLTTPAVVGCGGGGGGRFASLNPFGKKDAVSNGITSPEIAPPEIKAVGQSEPPTKLASFNQSAKGTLDKTASGVKNLFVARSATKPTDEDQTDPLSLDNKPEKVHPKVHVASGQLWESTGKPDKAIEAYQKALAIEPNHVDALSNLARLNYRQSNYTAAAELFQKALAGEPNNAQLYNELGLTLHKIGRTDMAITVMQRALQISPGTSRFANNLASVMHESGNAAGAYEVLVKNNKPAVAHFNMAYLQYKSGNVVDAKKHLAETMKFESAAGTDAAVGRAVARGKDMLAQIEATSPSSPTQTPQLPAGMPAVSAPAAGTIANQVTPPPATPTKAQTEPAGFVLPPSMGGNVKPASSTTVDPAAVKPASETAAPKTDAGVAPIPTWLKEATAAKPTTADAKAVKKPTRVQ